MSDSSVVDKSEVDVSIVQNRNLPEIPAEDTFIGYNIECFRDPLVSHISPLFTLGAKRTLEFSDLGKTTENNSVAVCKKQFRS